VGRAEEEGGTEVMDANPAAMIPAEVCQQNYSNKELGQQRAEPAKSRASQKPVQQKYLIGQGTLTVPTKGARVIKTKYSTLNVHTERPAAILNA